MASGETFGGRVHLAASDNAASNYSLTGYANFADTIDVLAYYNFVDRDNYAVGGDQILNENGEVVEGTDGEVRGLKGELDDGLIKIGWTIAENQRVKFGYERYVDEGDYSYRPDMGLATDTAIADSLSVPLVYPTEFTRDTYTLNYDLDLGNTTLKASLYQNESSLWRDETGLNSWRPPAATLNEGRADNTGANAIAITELDGDVEQTLTYGFEVIQYETHYIVDGVELGGEQSTISAIYIQDRIALENGVVIIPGVRYESTSLEAVVVDDTFSKATGALAIEYQANEHLLLSVSATELFKSPELSEVFIGAGTNDLENADIEAEEGYNAQIAAAYQNGGFDAGVTLFQTKIEDYIFDNNPVPNSRQYLKDNVGHMFIDGVEMYAGYAANQWEWLITYSNDESDLKAFSEYASLDGARIDRQQGETLTLSASYDVVAADLTLYWDMQIVGSVEDGPALGGAGVNNSKDSFNVQNVSARWTPGQLEGFAVTVGVDNLFDEFYASHSSQTGTTFHPLFGSLYLMDYEPGRNVKASVSYQF